MSGPFRIAILGGSGAEGSGLALRLAAAGHTVTIGSRSAEKAAAAAVELSALLNGATIAGIDNKSAAGGSEIVILTVPGTQLQLNVVTFSAALTVACSPLVPPVIV